MERVHPIEDQSLKKQMLEVRTLVQKRKDKNENFRSNMKQLKLGVSNNNLFVQNLLDPQLQSRVDLACVLFCAETFTSFNAASKLQVVLEAIWPGKHKATAKQEKPYLPKQHLLHKTYELIYFQSSHPLKNLSRVFHSQQIYGEIAVLQVLCLLAAIL